MVMPIGIRKIECKKCVWSCVVNFRSDCITLQKCKKCWVSDMEIEQPSIADKLANLVGFLR